MAQALGITLNNHDCVFLVRTRWVPTGFTEESIIRANVKFTQDCYDC